MCSRFDTVSPCNRQTDRQTDGRTYILAMMGVTPMRVKCSHVLNSESNTAAKCMSHVAVVTEITQASFEFTYVQNECSAVYVL